MTKRKEIKQRKTRKGTLIKLRYCMIWHGVLPELKLTLQEYIAAYTIWRLTKEGTRPFKKRTRIELSDQLNLSKNSAAVVMNKLLKKGIIKGYERADGYDVDAGYLTSEKWNRVIEKYEYYNEEDKPENTASTQYWNGYHKDFDLTYLEYCIMTFIRLYTKNNDEWVDLNQKKLAVQLNSTPPYICRKLEELVSRKDLLNGEKKDLYKVANYFNTGMNLLEERYQREKPQVIKR